MMAYLCDYQMVILDYARRYRRLKNRQKRLQRLLSLCGVLGFSSSAPHVSHGPSYSLMMSSTIVLSSS